jgi:hypothetical protein
MFRAVPRSSSGGQIVLLQHLLPSLTVNGCILYKMQRLEVSCAVRPVYASLGFKGLINLEELWKSKSQDGSCQNLAWLI